MKNNKAAGYKLEEQTRKMLNTIRALNESKTKVGLLTEEEDDKSVNENGEHEFTITKTTRNFGDVRTSQEEELAKVIGEDINFTDDALVYTWKNEGSKDDVSDNLIFSGRITSQNIVFQFKYRDKHGDGCYIWVEELQLSDKNLEVVNKIKSGFSNWKDNITNNSGDLLDKLYQTVTNKK